MLNILSINFKRKVLLLSSMNAVVFLKVFVYIFEFVESAQSLHCPSMCSCSTVRKNEQDFPPTYSKVPLIGNCTYTLVNCESRQLSSIPAGMRSDTAILFLDYNHIQYLNRSMMKGLDEVQVLSLTHNNLLSIDNDTFDDLPLLEQLDLSYNQIRRMPRGLLCPWYRRGSGGNNEISGCNGLITAQTRLHLTINHNPWHCNCLLQQILEHSICMTFEELSCVVLGIDKNDPIGYCMSPIAVKGVEIRRLYYRLSKKKNFINVCDNRHSYVDIPLLFTIFTWMGVVLGYVVYFISWNNRDIANHRSYLSTLNFQNRSRCTDLNKKHRRPTTMQDDHEVTETDQKRPGSETANHRRITNEKECLLSTAENTNMKPKNRTDEESEVILRPSAPPTDAIFRLSSL